MLAGTLVVSLSVFPQLMEAMEGKQGVVECTFVRSDVASTPYFSTPCRLGRNGLEENLGMGQLSEFEKAKLQEVGRVMYTCIGENFDEIQICSYFSSVHHMHSNIFLQQKF